MTPDKQAAQILAIYPVVAGQKFNQTIVIPSRASLSEQSARPRDLAAGEGDLIDFGSDAPAPQQPPPDAQPLASGTQPPLDLPQPGAVTEELPVSTGSRQEGALNDFHHDLKRDLPRSVKRTESTESDDEFVDAQG